VGRKRYSADSDYRYLRPEELVKIAEKAAAIAKQDIEDTKAQLAQALAKIKELEGG
jgi:hypothetical protein